MVYVSILLDFCVFPIIGTLFYMRTWVLETDKVFRDVQKNRSFACNLQKRQRRFVIYNFLFLKKNWIRIQRFAKILIKTKLWNDLWPNAYFSYFFTFENICFDSKTKIILLGDQEEHSNFKHRINRKSNIWVNMLFGYSTILLFIILIELLFPFISVRSKNISTI